MDFSTFLYVQTILFMVIVLPIWVVMHYTHKNKASRGLSESDQEMLDDLLRTVDSMADRMETLEAILDDHHPSWRRDSDRT